MGWFKGQNKYNARRSKCALGHNHGSAFEAAVCATLQLRERAGEIRDIKTQVRIHLVGKLFWNIDFQYTDCATGEICFAESKGFETQRYVAQKQAYSGCRKERLEIYKGSAIRPYVAEVIKPNG